MKKDFWEDWKNKTTIEKRAIKVVEIARKKIIKAIPIDKLFAIYIKGSFVRREMKKRSDIDIVPIVTENKYEGEIFSVNSPKISPAIVVPLSLWELKNNKLFTKGGHNPDLRAKPDRLLSKLKECKLIYGKPLNPKEFPIRSDQIALKDEIEVIKKGYIPTYQKGNIKFSPLLKEVFWLVELEQKVRGKLLNHSFEGISKSVKNKNHIIHEALKFRKGKLNGKKYELQFIQRLANHLNELS
jgi:hypothetical protein